MQRPASLKNSAKQKLNRFESISLFLFQTEQIMAGPIVEFSAYGQLNKRETPTTDWVSKSGRFAVPTDLNYLE